MDSVSIRRLSSVLLQILLCLCTWKLSWSQNHTLTVTPTTPEDKTCELIDGEAIPWCAEIGYNMTGVPNFRGHQSQAEAFEELEDYRQLIDTRCSGALLDLLCSVYAPPCFEYDSTVFVLPPCKNLCWEVRNNCLPWFTYSGDKWPEHLECDMFPEFNPNGGECFGIADPSTLQFPPNLPPVSCIPQLPEAAATINGAATLTSFSITCIPPSSSASIIAGVSTSVRPSATRGDLTTTRMAPTTSVTPTLLLPMAPTVLREVDSSYSLQASIVCLLILTILSLSLIM